MYLIAVGLSHKTAPLEVREQVAVSRDGLPPLLARLKELPSLYEVLIVSTCNRTELYAVATGYHEAKAALMDYFSAHSEKTPWPTLTYVLKDSDVVEHALKVASGLESMVVGEDQVLFQFKEAAEVAREANAVGPILNGLIQTALSTGKQVRAETSIGKGVVSLSRVALELARRIFGDQLSAQKLLVVGVGEMSTLSARYFVEQGVHSLTVTNRTFAEAQSVAAENNGSAIPFEKLGAALHDADIVVTSTGASRFIMSKELMEKVVRSRKGRPLFVMDLAVPRDVDPRVGDFQDVFLYNVDDLQQIAEENLKGREEAIPLAEALVRENTARLMKWLNERRVVPAITALRAFVDEFRRSEVDKALALLPDLDARSREVLITLSRSLTNKLVHRLIQKIKESSQETGDPTLSEIVHRIAEDPEFSRLISPPIDTPHG